MEIPLNWPRRVRRTEFSKTVAREVRLVRVHAGASANGYTANCPTLLGARYFALLQRVARFRSGDETVLKLQTSTAGFGSTARLTADLARRCKSCGRPRRAARKYGGLTLRPPACQWVNANR